MIRGFEYVYSPKPLKSVIVYESGMHHNVSQYKEIVVDGISVMFNDFQEHNYPIKVKERVYEDDLARALKLNHFFHFVSISDYYKVVFQPDQHQVIIRLKGSRYFVLWYPSNKLYLYDSQSGYEYVTRDFLSVIVDPLRVLIELKPRIR